MNTFRLAMLLFGALLVIVLPMLTGQAGANPLSIDFLDSSPVQSSYEEPTVAFQPRVGMVQTLTCTNPNCMAQCRGRGYRRGSCQIAYFWWNGAAQSTKFGDWNSMGKTNCAIASL